MRKSNLFSWWIFYSFEEKRGKTQFCPVEYRRKMQKKSHKKNIWKRDNFFTKTTRLGCIISYNRNKVKVLVKCDSLSGFLWSRTDCEKMSMILEVERDRSMAICFGATQHDKRNEIKTIFYSALNTFCRLWIEEQSFDRINMTEWMWPQNVYLTEKITWTWTWMWNLTEKVWQRRTWTVISVIFNRSSSSS